MTPKPTNASETEGIEDYIYISPKGVRFASLKAALQHAGRQRFREGLEKESKFLKQTAFDENTSMTIQITSNWEDYLHRDLAGLFGALPWYVYCMWVYPVLKKTQDDALAQLCLNVPFHESYGTAQLIRAQRLSQMPRVPEISGLAIPSPDVDPHTNSLIKLLLFKPMHASEELDEEGNPKDAYSQLYLTEPGSGKRFKPDPDANPYPYDAFRQNWNSYWHTVILPTAKRAEDKIALRKEHPTIWETEEVFAFLKMAAQKQGLLPCDAMLGQAGIDLQVRWENRLTMHEYACYLSKGFARNLDAFARARASPRIKAYLHDNDAVEDPVFVETSCDQDECVDAEDVLEPEFGEQKLKVGDAPEKVYHPHTHAARLKALTHHREKTTKFVRDMIAWKLLPITANTSCLEQFLQKRHVAASSPSECQVRPSRNFPLVTQDMLQLQRMAFDDKKGVHVEVDPSDPAASEPEFQQTFPLEALWQHVKRPSIRMQELVSQFETSSFTLAAEQRALCTWFGQAMDVAYEEESHGLPIRQRTQKACLVIGAGGTGKTTVILNLLLELFVEYFEPINGEPRYMITTYSHAQSESISNNKFRAKTAHSAASYRVASLRNRDMALKTKLPEMQRRWQHKILLVEDEISLIPASVQNMLLYRSMRARQQLHLIEPETYADKHFLLGKVPIIIIAGDFLQIRPANEISLADDLAALHEQGKRKIWPEHEAAQRSMHDIEDIIHLKKSKRFLDTDLPEIMEGLRASRPDKPVTDELLHKLRSRSIEKCHRELTSPKFAEGDMVSIYWDTVSRCINERCHRDAQRLNCVLYCLQAADKRHRRADVKKDELITHQLLTVANPHKTGRLPGMLLLHEGMCVRLSDVICAEYGLVKDKLGEVVSVQLHHRDQKHLDSLTPGYRTFAPEFLARGVWIKVPGLNNAPLKPCLLERFQEQDASCMIFVELANAEFHIDLKIDEEQERIEVIRYQFPLLHGKLRTAYAAQGVTFHGGVIVDLRRLAGLENDDYWLALYVMLSRARRLTNLLLIGWSSQVESLLKRGPPTHLAKLTAVLETKAEKTFEKLIALSSDN